MDSLMEKVVLAAVLALSLLVLTRIVRRSLTASPEKRGGCCGCPLAGECGPADADGSDGRECTPSDNRLERAPGGEP